MKLISRWEGRGGVGIIAYSNIHVMLTRPAIYDNKLVKIVQMNLFMCKTHLNAFIDVWGSWHKTEENNVLSDLLLDVHCTI